jgi:hypothetical protein
MADYFVHESSYVDAGSEIGSMCVTIDAFGTSRCLIESNFPPDGRSSGFIPTPAFLI